MKTITMTNIIMVRDGLQTHLRGSDAIIGSLNVNLVNIGKMA